MSSAVDINGKIYNRGLMIIVILVGTFCNVLNQTILSTAYPTIMNSFKINTSTVQWLTTGFMLVTGIMIPITAWLSTRFSSKWLYITAMTIFTIGTIVCFISPNFATLLIGRLIQAVGVGITMPLLQTIMLSIFPSESRGTAMGLAGIVVGLAPAIGPTLSGWVIDNWTWRDLFGMMLPILILVLFFSFFFVKKVLKNEKKDLDKRSILFSTIGFGSLLYGFSSVGDDGWASAKVISFLIVGMIVIALFIKRQLTMKSPFLELRVYRSVPFTISSILTSVSMMAMIGFELVLPLYLQIVKGMSALNSGLTMLFGALLLGVMSPINGHAVDKFGARRLAIMGMLLLSLGSIPFVFITNNTPNIYIVLLYAVRMFGISLTMMPTTTVGMNALPVDLLSHGTAVNNTQRQISSAVGTAILTSVLSNVAKNGMPSKQLLKTNPLQYKDATVNAILVGYHAAFMVAVVFCIIALFTSFFMKNRGHASDYTVVNRSDTK